jgi:hypothetical protein
MINLKNFAEIDKYKSIPMVFATTKASGHRPTPASPSCTPEEIPSIHHYQLMNMHVARSKEHIDAARQ